MSNAQSNGSKPATNLLRKAVLLDLLEASRKDLEEAGYLQPTLYIDLSNGQGIVSPLEMPDKSNKKYRMFHEIGKHICSTFGAIQDAVMVAETWTVSGKEAPDATKYPPSQHPCRQEAIMLVGRNADKTRSAFVSQTFTRDEHNALVWSEPKVILSDSGEEGVVAEGLIDALFDE